MTSRWDRLQQTKKDQNKINNRKANIVAGCQTCDDARKVFRPHDVGKPCEFCDGTGLDRSGQMSKKCRHGCTNKGYQYVKQPKVFVGKSIELDRLVNMHGWDRRRIKLINSVEAAYRLRGLMMSKDDIVYGRSIAEFTAGTAFTISQELQHIIKKG